MKSVIRPLSHSPIPGYANAVQLILVKTKPLGPIAMQQEIVEVESVSAQHLSVLVMVSQQELIVMQVVIVEMEYANALLLWLRVMV